MADIFDTLAVDQTQDIFDEIADNKKLGLSVGRLVRGAGQEIMTSVADVARANKSPYEKIDPTNPEHQKEFRGQALPSDRLMLDRRVQSYIAEGETPRMAEAMGLSDVKTYNINNQQAIIDNPTYQLSDEFKGKSSGILEDAVRGMAKFAPAMAMQAIPGGQAAGTATILNILHGSRYQEGIKNGESPDVAFRAAQVSAIGQAPIEYLGNVIGLKLIGRAVTPKNAKPFVSNILSKFTNSPSAQKAVFALNKLGPTGKRISAVIEGGFTEGLEEYAQYFPGELANEIAATPEEDFDSVFARFLTKVPEYATDAEAWQGAKVGFVGGTLFPGFGGVFGTARDIISPKKIEPNQKHDVLNPEENEEPTRPENQDELGLTVPDYAERVNAEVVDESPSDAIPLQQGVTQRPTAGLLPMPQSRQLSQTPNIATESGIIPASMVDELRNRQPGLSEEEIAQSQANIDVPAQFDVDAHEAATSPLNEMPEPTEAQKSAGNYKLGHTKIRGMDVSIENPAGSVRKGTDEDGKAWETQINHHYGYLKGTVGFDKDHLDVFIGPEAETAKTAYIIDQKNQDGSFDEHKVVIGAQDAQDALDIYNSNYVEGWEGAGAVTPMPIGKFRRWSKSKAPRKGALAYKQPEQKIGLWSTKDKEIDQRIQEKPIRENLEAFLNNESVAQTGRDAVGKTYVDEEGNVIGKNVSVNPQWVQDAIQLSGGLEKLKAYVRKAVAGEKLGSKARDGGYSQREAVKMVIDEYVSQRDRVFEDNELAARDEQGAFLDADNAIFPEDWTEDTLTLHEISKKAIDLLGEDAVIDILESNRSDGAIAKELNQAIKDYENGKRSEESGEVSQRAEENSTNQEAERDGAESEKRELQEEVVTSSNESVTPNQLTDKTELGDQTKLFATPSKFGTKTQKGKAATNEDMHFNDLQEEDKQGDILAAPAAEATTVVEPETEPASDNPADLPSAETETASSTGGASKLIIPIDKIPAGLEVTTKIIAEKSGRKATAKIDAKMAVESMNSMVEKLNSLLDCVRS